MSRRYFQKGNCSDKIAFNVIAKIIIRCFGRSRRCEQVNNLYILECRRNIIAIGVVAKAPFNFVMLPKLEPVVTDALENSDSLSFRKQKLGQVLSQKATATYY